MDKTLCLSNNNFTIKDAKIYVAVLLSLYQQKTMKNYQKSLAKYLKDQCIGENIKQKVTIKIQHINIRVNRTITSFMQIKITIQKGIKPNDNVYQKVMLPSVIKKLYDQHIRCDIRCCEQIGNLRTGQGEDYTTGCSLDYEYIKNRYRLISVHLSIQEKLYADPKVVQLIEFIAIKKSVRCNCS